MRLCQVYLRIGCCIAASCAVAAALAQTMDGVVTDDNGQLLTAQTMDVIGSELESLYDTLEQRDLAAGSLLARRLFA